MNRYSAHRLSESLEYQPHLLLIYDSVLTDIKTDDKGNVSCQAVYLLLYSLITNLKQYVWKI